MADISLSSPRRSSIAVVFAAGGAAPSGKEAALGTGTGACECRDWGYFYIKNKKNSTYISKKRTWGH